MIVGSSFDAIQLRNMIKGIFTDPPKENILWTAWQRFAEYDLNSSRHRNQWHRLKKIPLILAVVSTLIVLIYSVPSETTPLAEENQNALWTNGYRVFMNGLARVRAYDLLDLLFRVTIILLPITSSIILGVETRLKLGSKYILLRGAAEAVKRGIYSFRILQNRTATDTQQLLPSNEPGLAAHLGKISKILLDSDVNETAFAPYEGRIPPNMFGAEAYDDGFSPLDPETYIKIRIGDQLKFYILRTNQYEKRIRRLQYLMLIFGGVGTFLAAVGAQYWLPLTAAIVSAATAFLEYQQLEQILTKYNLTRASLENARSNWLALPENERYEDKNVQKLVRDVEATLESENQGWVQYVNQVQEESGAKA
jgi:SMODS and SLOG-associating 2TM effector domain 1